MAARRWLTRRLPRIWLAIHSSTWVSMLTALRRRPALDVGIGRQRNRARRHRQAGLGRRMMGDRLGQEIVETAIVGTLGGGVADFKQRLGFGAAHRLMLDRADGQDARAPGGVIGIERAGKMNTALRGGPFAGDHAVAHDGERVGCGLAAGRLRDDGGFGGCFSGLAVGAGIVCTSQFLFLRSSFSIPGMNERLTIRNRHFEIFTWLPIGRCDVGHGSGQMRSGWQTRRAC